MRDYEYVNGVRVRPKKSLLTRLGHTIVGALALTGVAAIVLMVSGWKPFQTSAKVKNSGSREAIIEEEEKFHGIILTNENVMTQLNEIAELMTYSQEYAGRVSVVDSLQVPYTDMDIWGTQHEIEIMYSGTIKVGYDLRELKAVVNNQKKEIYITLPKNPIVDNNLPQEKVTCVQDNNIFNPIRADEVNVRLSEVKEQQLQAAINDGIYEKANQHMREIIIKTLATVHSEYKVIFLDSVAQ
ncbi:MAG: DUF4230 domain-containing protein [Clostridiales bacterium]|nr:DUF4230 domain-containing protein [Clostridiales bacterium]